MGHPMALDKLPESVLYDLLQDAATVLTGLYLERQRQATDPDDAASWWGQSRRRPRPGPRSRPRRPRRTHRAGRPVAARGRRAEHRLIYMVDGREHGDIDDRLDRQVQPYVFGGHQPSASARLVLLGAQPGAGKSRAVARILGADPDTDFVCRTGDALRPPAGDPERDCPDGHVEDVSGAPATRGPASLCDQDGDDDPGQDAQGVRADRHWPYVPDTLRWTGR
jgi:hypothetical protein